MITIDASMLPESFRPLFQRRAIEAASSVRRELPAANGWRIVPLSSPAVDSFVPSGGPVLRTRPVGWNSRRGMTREVERT
jgi:hypothetical protein